MRKIIYSSIFLFVSAFAFGQSVTITPSQTTNQSNTGGENINVTANSNSLGIYGRRFNGTFASKTPVINGNELFRVSAGGWYDATTESQHASIKFNATENWGFFNSGSKITFTTTQNGGTSEVERMVINHNGNVGIGNFTPTAKLHINHLASPSSPTLHLQSTGASSSIIKATSTAFGSEWENHFLNNASAASNLVYWTNSVNSTTPLILTGAGDAVVERNVSVGGFTNLGTGAPKIKMITITNTTAGTEGGSSNFAHGLTASKIIDYQVLVEVTGGGVWVQSNHTTFAERQFDTELNTTNLRVFNHPTNSGSITNRPIKVVLTYTE
jgi:hypothetical protein